MSGESSRNEGIKIIAEFKDRAVSMTGVPEVPTIVYGRSKNAGITIIADFKDKARAVDEVGPSESTPKVE